MPVTFRWLLNLDERTTFGIIYRFIPLFRSKFFYFFLKAYPPNMWLSDPIFNPTFVRH